MKARTAPLDDAFWFQEGPGVRKWQFTTSGIKLLNVGNIRSSGEIDLSKTDRCLGFEEVEKRYKHFLIDEGDLVIASSGISFDSDGLLRTRGAFIDRSHLPLCLNTSTIRFKSRKGADLRYLRFWLDSYEFRSQITRRVTGSAQQNFGPSHLQDMRITLPNFSEQKRIAGLLERADRLRRTRRYAIEIGDTCLPAAFLDLFGDPDINPKKNVLVAAGEVFDIQLGKMLDAKRYTGKYLRPYLGNANVQWGRVALDDLKQMDFPGDDFERFKLKRGDILVCEGGEVGRTAIWQGEVADCCYQKALHRLRRTRDDILSEYFLQYMRAAVTCGLVARHSSTATIGHFSKETFEEFPVMLPPLALQKHFAELVRRHERLQVRQREALRQADHLFQSLLDQSFSAST